MHTMTGRWPKTTFSNIPLLAIAICTLVLVYMQLCDSGRPPSAHSNKADAYAYESQAQGRSRHRLLAARGELSPWKDPSSYNSALGCWHTRTDLRGMGSLLHYAAEANFARGIRWDEIQRAINMTYGSNPTVHYILVTSSTESLQLLQDSTVLAKIPHDVWYCSEVLYGTPIAIASLYNGTKLAMSIDNWIPPLPFACKFTIDASPVAYVLRRQHSKELTNQDLSCKQLPQGSSDGFMFEKLPVEIIKHLRFPRTFWGCENLAMYVMKRAGVKLVNMCPAFAPVHAHKVQDRQPGRLRLNHPKNSVKMGQDIPISTLCRSNV